MSLNNFINNPHFRIFLFPLALFYWGVIFWRNIFYNLGVFVSYSLPCKVISVGNITVGGTGKTPAVIYLAKLLKNNGCRVGVLSRGYGRITKGTIDLKENKNKDWKHFGEEPLLISKKLIDVPVVVDNNRFRGGRYLFKKYKPQIIILDDEVDGVIVTSKLSTPSLTIAAILSINSPAPPRSLVCGTARDDISTRL